MLFCFLLLDLPPTPTKTKESCQPWGISSVQSCEPWGNQYFQATKMENVYLNKCLRKKTPELITSAAKDTQHHQSQLVLAGWDPSCKSPSLLSTTIPLPVAEAALKTQALPRTPKDTTTEYAVLSAAELAEAGCFSQMWADKINFAGHRWKSPTGRAEWCRDSVFLWS